jgi:hypothetical protein
VPHPPLSVSLDLSLSAFYPLSRYQIDIGDIGTSALTQILRLGNGGIFINDNNINGVARVNATLDSIYQSICIAIYVAIYVSLLERSLSFKRSHSSIGGP